MGWCEVSRRICLVWIVALCASLGAQDLAAFSLDDLQWKRRIIVAFGEDGDANVEQLLEQVREHGCEVDDRDIDIFLVTSQGSSPVTANAPQLNQESEEYLVSLHHPTDTGFEMILIGKDGGVKAREATADALIRFFELIDSMPMRQREIEERGLSC